MPNQPAAPSEADAPRPLARAILHAQSPAALKLLLLALLAALSVATFARAPVRRPHKDWLLSLTTDPTEDSDWDPYVLRRVFRLRARLGWLMRCDRAEGMSLSGHRAPVPRPTQAARAPPMRSHAQNHPESVTKTPRPAAMTHARSAAPTPTAPESAPPSPSSPQSPAHPAHWPGTRTWRSPAAAPGRRTNAARSRQAQTASASPPA